MHSRLRHSEWGLPQRPANCECLPAEKRQTGRPTHCPVANVSPDEAWKYLDKTACWFTQAPAGPAGWMPWASVKEGVSVGPQARPPSPRELGRGCRVAPFSKGGWQSGPLRGIFRVL